MGAYWPSMRKDVYAMVRECGCKLGINPNEHNAMNLFHVNDFFGVNIKSLSLLYCRNRIWLLVWI